MILKIKLKKGRKRRGLLDCGDTEDLSPQKRRKMEELAAARLRISERTTGKEEAEERAVIEEKEFETKDGVVVTDVEPAEFGTDEEVVEAVVGEVEPVAEEEPLVEEKDKPEVEEEVRPKVEEKVEPVVEEKVRAEVVERVKKVAERDEFLQKVIDYGILGLIVLSPIPKASVNEWSVMLIELVVFAMMIAYFLMSEKPQINEYLARSLVWPRRLFLALFIFLFVQILPLPSFLIRMLSPNAYSFRETFSAGGSTPAFMSFSMIAPHTIRDGLELLAYFLIGFLIVKTVTRQRQIYRIFYVLVGMGIFQAFYGFLELYNTNPRLLFYEKEHYLDALTGTFVNRNHLSGYLEMAIPLAIGLILARSDLLSAASMKWKERLLRLSEKGVYQNLLLSIGIIVMALGIIFSKSRSGVFLLVFTFILFLGFSVMFFRRSRHRQIWMRRFIWAVFMAVIFISLYIGIDATIERFSLDEILREGRPTVWGNTVGIISDFPLFGSGLGTFTSLYPAYEQVKMQARYSHAHNDYLQYFSELGIVGMILLLGGILFILVTCFLAWRERRRAEVKGLGLGGIIAVVAILIHSITDFNLQIPANMLLFSVVLSLTLVIVFYKRTEGAERTTEKQVQND
jgi:O-antigen ligase